MSRIAYVNGRYLPLAHASVNIEDRGYQFSDGVYEVCEVRSGRLVDERRHLERLGRSLTELRIAMPMAVESLGVIMREVVRRNRVRWGIVYLQITRGVSRRDHAFPPAGTKPSIVVTARKRAEDVQDIPDAISVLSEQVVEAGDLDQIEDFVDLVPNASFSNDSETSSEVSIRKEALVGQE